MGERTSFRYIQTVNNGTRASVYFSGALTVKQGASFYMQAGCTTTTPLTMAHDDFIQPYRKKDRVDKTTWTLLISVDGNFQTKSGHVLPKTIVFVDVK